MIAIGLTWVCVPLQASGSGAPVVAGSMMYFTVLSAPTPTAPTVSYDELAVPFYLLVSR